MLKLYSYYRSTAAYRVRIALNYKKLAYTQQAVHLVKDGGQQFSTDYSALNPQHLVPCLMDTGKAITQSLSILDYLEERFPERPILPQDRQARAYVRSIAQIIACDTHPLNNLRVLQYLKNELGISQTQQHAWYCHWIQLSFQAIETLLAENASKGEFCYGTTPTIADMCLVPQVYNAKRFDCPLDKFPIICQINAHCTQLPAFIKAHPEQQPDAV